MNLVCRNLDGDEFRVPAKTVREIIPCTEIYTSESLLEPTTGLVHYESMLLPLRGSAPEIGQEAWIMVLAEHGEILAALPEIETDAKSERKLNEAVRDLSTLDEGQDEQEEAA